MRRPLEAARKTGALRKAEPRLQRTLSDLAASQSVRACVHHLFRNKQWINEQHLQLCRIASPTFFEEKRAEWMAAQFKALGWESRIDRAGNVIAYPGSHREGPFVALTAHLDTVLAPRQAEDVRVGPDGRFHGPGVSDNGAGLAALLALAASWKEHPLLSENGLGVVLVANVGEEGEGNLNGMRFLCKQSPMAEKIRSYVVLDGPGTDHITCRALASRRFEVVVSGPGGHSWSDHGNANPVHSLSRAVHYFNEGIYEDEIAGPPRSSYNFGMIEGGISVNSIPSSARAKLDVRSEDPARIEAMARNLVYAVEKAVDLENERATGGRVHAKIRDIGARPGGTLSDQSQLLPYLRAVDAYLGIRARLDCASTDANIPLSLGMEALSIGAGGRGGGAHTTDEWYDPEGREMGLHRVVLTLGMLLSE
ncbi:MAG TPA: M20/M25/M40 family metallo-hydrolase [Bryobacteraceae bacterium]|nr:M20/M25/M40 family metallo-hydrolase [Bryobacteraceae bacterium]